MSAPDEYLNVFDGQRIKAQLFDVPGSDKPMIVRIQHRIKDLDGFAAPTSILRLQRQGHAILNIQTAVNDWFINPETMAFEAELTTLGAHRPGCRMLGFSMGGYGALRFGKALQAHSTVLVSPQFSIHPKVVGFEKRYHADAGEYDLNLGDLSRVADPNLRGVLFYDPFVRRDRRHAELIQELYPKLRLVRLPGGGHPATGVLNGANHSGLVLNAMLQAHVNPRPIQKLHRRLRGDSPKYWRRLSRYASKRFPELRQISRDIAEAEMNG